MNDDGITRDDELEAYQAKAADADTDDARYQARDVLNLLTAQLKKDTDPLYRSEQLGMAADVLAGVADDNDAHDAIMSYVDDKASEIAADVQFAGDKIRGGMLPVLREAKQDAVMAGAGDAASSSWTLEHGVGIDEFVEDNIESVTKLTTTDHVDDVSLKFDFGDVQIEFDDSEYLFFDQFFAAVQRAADVRIRDEIASLQAAQYCHGDVNEEDSEAKAQYRDMSLGPRERPWSHGNWTESITHVIDEYSEGVPREDQPIGPRTEAWEYICDEIENGTVTSNRGDAVEYKAVYVPDDIDEVWIPTDVVDNACEDIAVTRGKLVSELDDRGVTTDRLSGRKVSEPVTENGSSLRMWRFDTTHPDVPVPVDVQESLSAGAFDNLPGASSGGAATATDGGAKTDGVTNDDCDGDGIDSNAFESDDDGAHPLDDTDDVNTRDERTDVDADVRDNDNESEGDDE